jgi:hypothetical protein
VGRQRGREAERQRGREAERQRNRGEAEKDCRRLDAGASHVDVVIAVHVGGLAVLALCCTECVLVLSGWELIRVADLAGNGERNVDVLVTFPSCCVRQTGWWVRGSAGS